MTAFFIGQTEELITIFMQLYRRNCDRFLSRYDEIFVAFFSVDAQRML